METEKQFRYIILDCWIYIQVLPELLPSLADAFVTDYYTQVHQNISNYFDDHQVKGRAFRYSLMSPNVLNIVVVLSSCGT